MGSLAQKLTVLGKTLFSVQLALFSAKCPKLRIFHTTGSCSGDNSEPESINRNYIYLTSGLWEYMARFSRTIFTHGALQKVGNPSKLPTFYRAHGYQLLAERTERLIVKVIHC